MASSLLRRKKKKQKENSYISSMGKFKCTLATAFNFKYDFCSGGDQTQQCMNNPVDSFGAKKT